MLQFTRSLIPTSPRVWAWPESGAQGSATGHASSEQASCRLGRCLGIQYEANSDIIPFGILSVLLRCTLYKVHGPRTTVPRNQFDFRDLCNNGTGAGRRKSDAETCIQNSLEPCCNRLQTCLHLCCPSSC